MRVAVRSYCSVLNYSTEVPLVVPLVCKVTHSVREQLLLSQVQLATTHCNTLQLAATHCNTLQYTATHCNAKVQLVRVSAAPCFDLGEHTIVSLYSGINCTSAYL